MINERVNGNNSILAAQDSKVGSENNSRSNEFTFNPSKASKRILKNSIQF